MSGLDYILHFVHSGNSYASRGQFSEAISDFTEAINLGKAINLSIYQVIAYQGRGLAYYEVGNFSAAISDFTKLMDGVIQSQITYHTYYNRGNAYKAQGKFTLAIMDYINALNKEPNHALCQKNLEEIFLNPQKGDLDKADKDIVISAITLLPIKKQIPLLKQSLDESSPLGRLFWRKDWFTPCSLGKGNLKVICDLLEKIDPNFKKPETKKTPSVNNQGVLFGYRSPEIKLREINPVFDHKIHKL
ncbi:MAG TPA: tetratricopeptide repeat protein [Waddliaceae bacterium]